MILVFMILLGFVYFTANIIAFAYLISTTNYPKDFKIYHLVLGLIFFPVTIIFLTTYLIIVSVEKIAKVFPKTKLGKFLNKKIF